jgi:hypothetical protein
MDSSSLIRVLSYDQQGKLGVQDVSTASGQVLSSRMLSCQTSQSCTLLSPDGRLLVFAAWAASPTTLPPTEVVIWDVERDREIARIPGTTPASTVALSVDLRLLAIGREGGSIEVWDFYSRTLRGVFRPHSASFDPRALWFSPDGGTLASMSLWDTQSITVETIRWGIALLRGNGGRVAPHELAVMEAATGRLLLRTGDEAGPCFSADGRSLATLHRDGSVWIRDLPQASRSVGAHSRSP